MCTSYSRLLAVVSSVVPGVITMCTCNVNACVCSLADARLTRAAAQLYHMVRALLSAVPSCRRTSRRGSACGYCLLSWCSSSVIRYQQSFCCCTGIHLPAALPPAALAKAAPVQPVIEQPDHVLTAFPPLDHAHEPIADKVTRVLLASSLVLCCVVLGLRFSLHVAYIKITDGYCNQLARNRVANFFCFADKHTIIMQENAPEITDDVHLWD